MAEEQLAHSLNLDYEALTGHAWGWLRWWGGEAVGRCKMGVDEIKGVGAGQQWQTGARRDIVWGVLQWQYITTSPLNLPSLSKHTQLLCCSV